MTVPQTEQAAPGPASSGPPVLELADVAVHFGGVKAVDGISLNLRPGMVYGIIGPNGSGKTTLIGAITRLTRLTRGDLLLGGTSYTHLSPSGLAGRGVARTFQTVRLLPDLDVVQNILLGYDGRGSRDGSTAAPADRGPWWRRVLGRGVPAEVADAIARTGLQGFERYYPSELSYGTQRRVEIARAIVMNPRLLLLDEPTAGMNQAERGEISSLMKDLRGQGLCQLLVEHDVQMMIDTCDYVFAMNTGQLIAEGEPREVVQNPLVQEAYLGRTWREHAADR
jgi:branched-chain amino acid transport system ATP-binding protein